MLKLDWHRRGGSAGVEFTADHPDGRALLVKQITWTPPGFKKRTGKGWAGFVSIERTKHATTFDKLGAAYPRSCDARLELERATRANR